ncbi:hypothetical protein, partial [Klebsiella pneumoniae]|uniref:hypothetical protein n=1 Tax=Klebsiella pneumoniae TaxID=573 RepID=UPI00272F870D
MKFLNGPQFPLLKGLLIFNSDDILPTPFTSNAKDQYSILEPSWLGFRHPNLDLDPNYNMI